MFSGVDIEKGHASQHCRGVAQLILRRRIREKNAPPGFENKHQIIQRGEKSLQTLFVFLQGCGGGGRLRHCVSSSPFFTL